MSGNEVNFENVWSKDDLKRLFLLRRDNMPYSLIGTLLDNPRGADACRRKWNRTKWKEQDFYDKIDEVKQQLYDDTKEELREKQLRATENRLERSRIQTDILADAISAGIKALPKVTPPVYQKTKRTEQTHESEDVGLMLSDFHIGHDHSLEETGGISEYNKEIFARRMELLKESVVDIHELHSHLYDLPNLHIFCLGDIVAGMNAVGQWSGTFINTAIMEQLVKGLNTLTDMIYYWLGIFKEIHFYGVRGNHGRVAPIGMEKDNANWDILCYDMLKERFENNKQVTFTTPKTWWIKTTIKNHKFLIVHGDDIRAGAVPIKGLQTFVDKWASISGFIPNYTLAGHFHNAAEFSTPQGKLMINGSFIGPDVYAMKTVHAASRPEQKIFGIHNKRGITWSYDIDLSSA